MSPKRKDKQSHYHIPTYIIHGPRRTYIQIEGQTVTGIYMETHGNRKTDFDNIPHHLEGRLVEGFCHSLRSRLSMLSCCVD